MERALALAANAKRSASPNPMVGAVVVKDGRLVAEGWHVGPGFLHAEAVALDHAQDEARGATLYVTLEPCCHWGRTGPCTERILASGIRRVVAATVDPNPRVNGEGLRRLQEAGLDVATGLCAQEARLLNRAYFTWIQLGRPYVFAKIAQSLDGKVATRTAKSQWITSHASRDDGHRLRSQVDAILVGVGTVLADNPRLTARPPDPDHDRARHPLRVIVDSRGRTPSDARCLHEPGETLIATTAAADPAFVEAMQKQGVSVWVCPNSDRRVALRPLLEHLARRDVTSLLVEGGPTVLGSFRDEDLIDELHVYVAPMLIGGTKALSSVGGIGTDELPPTDRMVDVTWRQIDRDLKFSGRIQRPHLEFERGTT